MINSNKIIVIFLVVGLFFMSPARTWAQSPAGEQNRAKIQDIHRLLTLSDAKTVIKKQISIIISLLAGLYPEFPEKEWTSLLGDSDGTIIYDAVVSVYDQHLTHEQVKKLIGVYQLSKDAIRQNPELMMLLYRIRPFIEENERQILRDRLQKIQSRLKKYGYEVSEEELFAKIISTTNLRNDPTQKKSP